MGFGIDLYPLPLGNHFQVPKSSLSLTRVYFLVCKKGAPKGAFSGGLPQQLLLSFMGLLLLAPHNKPFGFATSLHPPGICWIPVDTRSEQRQQNPYDISSYWLVQVPGFLQWLISRIPKYNWAVVRPPRTG